MEMIRNDESKEKVDLRLTYLEATILGLALGEAGRNGLLPKEVVLLGAALAVELMGVMQEISGITPDAPGKEALQ